ncbi:MAG: histone deacetylase, partial [Actinomycetota bacterium]|nr:histone deacetylase [Actinomycetota bacterium]
MAAIDAALVAAGIDLQRLEAPPAMQDELTLVHSERHVSFIRELCQSGGGQIDADTYVGEASYEAALHAAGGACELARRLT